MERDEFTYADGRPVWFILLIIALWVILVFGYGAVKFVPDLANWMRGGDPDRIQWAIEAPGR